MRHHMLESCEGCDYNTYLSRFLDPRYLDDNY